jgi:hypothetical protein
MRRIGDRGVEQNSNFSLQKQLHRCIVGRIRNQQKKSKMKGRLTDSRAHSVASSSAAPEERPALSLLFLSVTPFTNHLFFSFLIVCNGDGSNILPRYKDSPS